MRNIRRLKRHFYFGVVVTAVLCTPFSSSRVAAQSSSAQRIRVGQKSTFKTKTGNPGGPQYRWAFLPWEKNDREFVQARREIDEMLRRGQSLSQVTTHNDQPYNLRDSLIQFRWGYALYETARRQGFNNKNVGRILSRLTEANIVAAPRNAEYSRLMFLLHARVSGGDPYTTDMGLRLAKRFPKDFEIKWFALQSIDTGRHPKYMKIGLSYARDLLRQQPNKAESAFLIATLYRNRWYTSWLRKDGEQATAEYQEAIAKLKKSDPRYKFGSGQIQFIRKTQPILEKRWNRRARQPKAWE